MTAHLLRDLEQAKKNLLDFVAEVEVDLFEIDSGLPQRWGEDVDGGRKV